MFFIHNMNIKNDDYYIFIIFYILYNLILHYVILMYI